MQIIIVSNFVNHYYAPLADTLYQLTNGNFYFIEVEKLPESFKKGGFSVYDRPYIIRAWESKEAQERAFQLAETADVMYAGGGKFILPYERRRLRLNKFTIECAERILKRGLLNMISPTNILTQLNYHFLFYNKPLYKLCISGYTANDMYFQHAFKDRCYKFGYFPATPKLDIEKVIENKKKNKHFKIVWCARFINWKHPELAVLLAEKLRAANYDFEINMISNGELYDATRELIEQKQLGDYVHLLGNYPNSEVVKIMEEHDIFLFTSDKREGWGVVLNEAMGRLCCPVASHLIGAVPFLLKNKQNGMVFKSGNLQSMYEAVKYLFDNPDEMRRMAVEAYHTVDTTWSPTEAAKRLYAFCEAHLQGKETNYTEGPLSKAVPIPENREID